jgi:selenocysteine lyase/cysteine desulfurase
MPAKLLTQWGVEARRVECVDGLISEDALISSIDKRTKMMIVPLVNFLTGLRLDVAKIARECRRAGVFLAVDAIQAAGPVKIDVRALGCHALCFGSPKWMFGPMGIGTCFIEREYIRKLKIPQVGMYAVKDPWNFFNYDQDFVDVAMVYECGCPAMMSHYGINPTLEMFLDIGPENIENYILKITGDFHDELTSRGVNVLTPREDSRRGAIISFDAASAGWENATEFL